MYNSNLYKLVNKFIDVSDILPVSSIKNRKTCLANYKFWGDSKCSVSAVADPVVDVDPPVVTIAAAAVCGAEEG